MNRLSVIIAVVSILCASSARGDRMSFYERSVTFTVYNNISDESYALPPDKGIAEYICDPNGKFAFVIHGWDEHVNSLWVKDTIRNLTYHRGGCVVFMDYARFSMNPDYFLLTTHFNRLADLLARKIRQVTTRYENVFMYGFSFGARLCFEAGARIGYQLIDTIHGCDPPGPGFDHVFRTTDPKTSAKNVHCINTSVDKGTNHYNCHVNFRMGFCGRRQIGASRKPFGSHGLCPFFYNSAFENDFISDNVYNCTSIRMATNVPRDFKMGYMETRRVYGDVFIPTAKFQPWNVAGIKHYPVDDLQSFDYN